MTTIDDKIREVLAESAELAAEMLTTKSVERKTGSPIEKLMLHALWSRSVWRGDFEFCDWAHGFTDELFRHQALRSVRDDAGFMFHGYLMQQMYVGPHRADFGVAAATSRNRAMIVAIECDGHDFHDRTRDQVARDKARDRAFAERDIRLFRFSGSEIWRDAGACADQVLTFVREWRSQPLFEQFEARPNEDGSTEEKAA